MRTNAGQNEWPETMGTMQRRHIMDDFRYEYKHKKYAVLQCFASGVSLDPALFVMGCDFFKDNLSLVGGLNP